MQSKKLFFLLVLATVFTAQACAQGHYKEAPTGLQYKFIRGSGSEATPKPTDVVTVKMDYFINDSLLFSSQKLDKPMLFPLNAPACEGDFFEGIAMMSQGDSASFLCNADSVFTHIFRVKRMPDFVKPGSMMRFEIALDSFISKEEYDESKNSEANHLVEASKKALQDYIQANGITVEPTASGLYFIEKEKGSGAQPKHGDRVSVHYRGTLLDGTQFDASYDRNKPFDFLLGMGQVIKGWDEGLSMMHEGGKATLILPYELAYGDRAAGAIPPFSPLIFEVELIEIIK